MHTRPALLLASTSALAVILAGCGTEEKRPEGTTRTVTSFEHGKVEVPVDPKRIVTLTDITASPRCWSSA